MLPHRTILSPSVVCHSGLVSYDTVVWLPNALVLTVVFGAFAWWRWRRKGTVAGLRWTGVAMLPLALYGIGLFRLVWSVGLALSRFLSGFVWRPSVWIGLILTAIAVALIVLPSKVSRSAGESRSEPKQVTSARKKTAGGDGDMADIEDILKRHGIG
jgi:hypothetical protein